MIIEISNIYSSVIMEATDEANPIGYLRRKMKVKLPGAHFMKGRKFDGYVRFISPKGKFLTGFLQEVVDLCDDDFSITISDKRPSNFRPKSIVKTIGDKEFWDFQLDGVNKALNNEVAGIYFPRGIMEAATNSGKSLMIASIAKTIMQPTLVVIHRKDIFNELRDLLSSEFGGDFGTVSSGDFNPKLITLAMAASLTNFIESDISAKLWVSQLKVIICDESHRGEHEPILAMVPCYYRFLFSGTHSEIRNPVAKAKSIGLSGNTLVKISNLELITRGVSQKPMVKIFLNKVSFDCIRTIDYAGKYKLGVIKSIDRMQAISDYIDSHPDHYVLIAVKRLEHAELLSKFLDVDYVSGKSSNREQLISDFREGKIKVLITTSILQEGVNLPLINCLIYSIGEFSHIAIKQFIGRAIRHDKQNTSVDIVDFFDQDYKILSRHSRNRIALYRKEGFDIEFKYDCNKNGEPR